MKVEAKAQAVHIGDSIQVAIVFKDGDHEETINLDPELADDLATDIRQAVWDSWDMEDEKEKMEKVDNGNSK